MLCLGLPMAMFMLTHSRAESKPRLWTTVGGNSAPPLLSETGLYARNGQIAARNLIFVPAVPLWSDGAAKSRWVYLPEAAKIDVSDIDSWQFPVGTIFWKEFAWAGRRVETRMIWKPTDSSWGLPPMCGTRSRPMQPWRQRRESAALWRSPLESVTQFPRCPTAVPAMNLRPRSCSIQCSAVV